MADNNETSAVPSAGTDDFDVDVSGSAAALSSPAAQPAEATDQQAGTSSLPPSVVDALRSENLKLIDGETMEAAWERYNSHMRRKNDRFYRDFKEARENERRVLSELQATRESLRPILEDYYNRQREQQTAQLAATIPDKETDPIGYSIWLNEQILARDRQREEQAVTDRLTAEQREQQQQAADYNKQLDEVAYEAVAAALGEVPGVEADQSFVQAYDTMSKVSMAAARDYFPTASDEELAEFVGLSQQLDYRRWVQLGQDPREVIKRRYESWSSLFGRPAAGQAAQDSIQQQPTPAMQSRPVAVPSIVTRQAAAAAGAARREPLTTPAVGRPAQAGTALPNPDDFTSSEDYVEAALDGLLGSDEDRVAKVRKFR